jgi:biopolymer transport protein ExbD
MRTRNRFRMRTSIHSEPRSQQVSLTSLMDIVTNILVYTIKIFAVSTITIQDPSVFLPSSSSRENPEDTVVVMITGKIRKEISENREIFVEEVPTIIVDDKVIQKVDPRTYRVPANAKERGYVITSLKRELLHIRKDQESTAKLTAGEGFNGRVVIIADKNTPYRLLADVLVTCGEAGFGHFKFAIVKREA